MCGWKRRRRRSRQHERVARSDDTTGGKKSSDHAPLLNSEFMEVVQGVRRRPPHELEIICWRRNVLSNELNPPRRGIVPDRIGAALAEEIFCKCRGADVSGKCEARRGAHRRRRPRLCPQLGAPHALSIGAIPERSVPVPEADRPAARARFALQTTKNAESEGGRVK